MRHGSPAPAQSAQNAEAFVGRRPSSAVGRRVPQVSRSSCERHDCIAGRIVVGVCHVLAEGSVAVGLRCATNRREPQRPVRHQTSAQRHEDAGNPGPARSGVSAAGVGRRVPPVATGKGAGTDGVLPGLLPAGARRHGLLFLANDPLRLLSGKEELEDRRNHLCPSDAGGVLGASRLPRSDSAGARTDRQTGRYDQKRLRTQRLQAAVAENSPGASPSAADHRGRRAGQQRPTHSGAAGFEHALHFGRKTRRSRLSVREADRCLRRGPSDDAPRTDQGQPAL